MPFDEAAHPRAEAGAAGGGQFVAGGGATGKSVLGLKAKGASLPTEKGGGGKGKGKGKGGGKDKKGDAAKKAKQTRALQQALTRLGLKGADGKPLKVDGVIGPNTTAAIKAAQRKYGMKPDGKVTPALLRRLAKPRMSKQKLKTRTPIKKAPQRPRSAPPRASAPPTTRRRPSSPRDSARDSVSSH
ncbi:peptidoglycan-binding domain-containing protein [Actinomadura luteofluorescens]|uniref:peptidoglycan-binding domain-containing protein n=1 Tax=Actinomadura luteofluorescens TaxID=46163 RepID=UPI003D8C0AB3